MPDPGTSLEAFSRPVLPLPTLPWSRPVDIPTVATRWRACLLPWREKTFLLSCWVPGGPQGLEGQTEPGNPASQAMPRPMHLVLIHLDGYLPERGDPGRR